MITRISKFGMLVVCIVFSSVVTGQSYSAEKIAAGVLKRVMLGQSGNIHLSIKRGESAANDYYQYKTEKNNLYVTATSVNALTRGVYDYLKNNHLGMLDWAGANFKIPAKLPDANITTVISPFKIRQAYNAVTFAYTTPYWTWARWEQELDWQAMHGFNTLLAPVATEAIAERVWKRLGLSQAELDSFYVSPTLLPFLRMGCIQNVGGGLPQQWHKDQIDLQHRILKRMRELDMQPIIQSFAGFVPKAITRMYPHLKLHNTLWNAGFPPSQRPAMLMPGDPLFATITKMYMEEWKKEFGDATYYLVDSFNELELPKAEKPITDILAAYGQLTYNAIKAANPDAVWVIQGWMFGYQRKQWPPENVKALFSKVPDDKVLILDYANDYANSWEPVNGFNGKQWVYGFVPNMGGKTAYTGDLNLYASGAAKTLKEPKKNNLVGFSISGEGLENNAVVYELLADAAWSDKPIDLHSWLTQFSVNRYGDCPPALQASWDSLLKSSYSYLIPHPWLNWQLGQFKLSEVNRSAAFYQSVKRFLSCRSVLALSKNYQADAIERVSLVLGIKAEEWFAVAAQAYEKKDKIAGDSYTQKGIHLLQELDRLMDSHPLNRLDRWVNFASQHTADKALKHFYESDARRIITIWGPPVNDYAGRVWSGLVRDFYIPRMKELLNAKRDGIRFDKNNWEINWVQNPTVSKSFVYQDPLTMAATLLDNALQEKVPTLNQ